MGDQDRRQVALAVELRQQIEDLRLDRHVERRCRLIRDQHLRLERQGHRDHRPLAHAAGELVRVVTDPPLGVRNPHRVEQLHRALPAILLANVLAVGSDRLDYLVAEPL